jgi:uncharacterized protein
MKYFRASLAPIPFFLCLCLTAGALSTARAGELEKGYGAFEARDYKSAFTTLHPLADRGDPASQYIIAYMLEKGLGTPADPALALAYFQRAADQGNANGQFALGYKYERGLGVKTNPSLALIYYLKAAEQGHAEAQNALGNIYELGRGVDANPQLALSYYRKAAALGSASAKLNLKRLTPSAPVTATPATPGASIAEAQTPPNPAQALYEQASATARRALQDNESVGYADAMSLYRQSAQLGHMGAQYALGQAYREPRLGFGPNNSEAFRWLLMAAQRGHVGAQYQLGLMYDTGTGTVADKRTAFHWFLLAANQGQPQACDRLGEAYFSGTSVARDYARALVWYQKAADAGQVSSMLRLKLMYEQGLGVRANPEQARVWGERAARRN